MRVHRRKGLVVGRQVIVHVDARNRLAEGKLPACAEMCSTKALLAGDAAVISDIFRERVLRRGKGADLIGWGTAYGKQEREPERPKEGSKS